MSVSLTADRVRSMLTNCKTEKQVLTVLKTHKVKFSPRSFSEGYSLNIYIPCKTGMIRVYRSCSRSAPFVVQHLTPVSFIPSGIPVFRPSVPYGSPYNGI